MKRKKLFIVMLFVALLLMPAWGVAAELRIGLKAEPSSMDPHYHNLTPNNMMSEYTFDKLVKQDHKQNLKQGLAAIEARARSELGLIREDETYFQLLDTDETSGE